MMNGALGEIRTPDLLIRSQMLYPAELRARDLLHNWFSVKRQDPIHHMTLGFMIRLCSCYSLVKAQGIVTSIKRLGKVAAFIEPVIGRSLA